MRNVNKQTNSSKFNEDIYKYFTVFRIWDMEKYSSFICHHENVFFQLYAFCDPEKIPVSKRFDEFFLPLFFRKIGMQYGRNFVKSIDFALTKLHFIFSIWDMANVQASCAENMLPRKQSSLNLLHFVYKKKRWSWSLGGLLQCFGTFLSIPHTVVLQMFGLS